MTPDDFEVYKAGMIALAAVTGKTLDILVERSYWTALEDVPGPIVARALREAMTRCEWFPSAAELRELCDECEHQQERLALAASPVPERLALPDPDAQYRGDSWEPPEQTYSCRECKDSGFVYYMKQDVRWATKCQCISPELDDSQKNRTIMARIRRHQEVLGLKKQKYARSRSKGTRRYGET